MRDAAATKQRLQDAALSSFVKKGITETSVGDLARAAGIAEGTLYRHYASKDDLVADLFISNYENFGRRIREMQEKRASFKGKLKAVIGEVCRFYDADPVLFRFLLLVQHQGLPRVTYGRDNPVSIIQAMIEAAIQSRAITLDDASFGTAMIFGLVLQPATAIVYGRMEAPLSRYADQITGACWRALNP
jgi:AcrR family transcriptional regulator